MAQPLPGLRLTWTKSIMSGLGWQVGLSALPSLLLHHACLKSTTGPGPGPGEPCLPQTSLLLGSDEPLGLGDTKRGWGRGSRELDVRVFRGKGGPAGAPRSSGNLLQEIPCSSKNP